MTLLASDFIFDFNELNNLNDKIISGINYLSDLKDVKELFIDQIAFNAFVFIGKGVAFGDKVIDRTNICKNNFPDFLGKLLMYLYNIYKEIEFKNDKDSMFYAEQSTDLNEKRVYTLSYCLYVLNMNAMNYVNFSTQFSSSDGLDAHFAFIKDEEFTSKHIDTMVWMWEKQISLIEYLVMNICSLSKLCDETRTKWIKLDSVNSLLNIKKKKISCELDACIAITNIADDKQIENLTEIHSVIDLLNKLINKASDDFAAGNLNRQNRQVFENNIARNCQVHCIFQVYFSNF
jgi:hypothetical protein